MPTNDTADSYFGWTKEQRVVMATNGPTLSLNKMGDVARPLIVRFQISKKDAVDSYLRWVEKQKYHRDIAKNPVTFTTR
ncbi:MAG: hypothetical protein LUQ44_04060, partial [Methanothrix sp.]|nr:hypothetical protein [Methanothrix sp.]